MTYSNANPKHKTYKNAQYLAYIRTLPCFFCGGIAEPHHVRRSYWGAGTGIKSHDYVSVPRCRTHHNTDTEDGVELEIIDNLMKYVESIKRK